MNDELTPREHSEMRDSILAGAQRIHSAGQRRMQVIAASVAFVLVAGISGGAVATAALLGSGVEHEPIATPSETVTQTPAPTPSLTPTTPPSPDPQAVVAFGGDCAAVLTDEEAAAATGDPMTPLAAPWSPGADEKLGGLACWWSTSEEYDAAEVRIWAYPAEVAETAGVVDQDSCTADGDPRCTRSGSSRDLWLVVTVQVLPPLDGEAIDGDALRAATEEVFSLAVTRADAFPAAREAARTNEWWTIDSCSAIVADLEADGALPQGSVVHDPLAELLATDPGMVPVTLGAARWCSVEQGPLFYLWPGGADTFPTVAALDASEPVDVPGAAGAIVAPSLDALEGHHPLVVVTDGVNSLAVSSSEVGAVRQEDIDFAAALLKVMAHR